MQPRQTGAHRNVVIVSSVHSDLKSARLNDAADCQNEKQRSPDRSMRAGSLGEQELKMVYKKWRNLGFQDKQTSKLDNGEIDNHFVTGGL